jgi:hypothetical protein
VNNLNTIALKASANGQLNISELEHPNRMPFKGVLTYLNRLSTEPPHGSKGLRVYIPTEVGAPAIASLKGMAINYIEGNPNGHDPKSKIGVITDAKLGETQSDGAVPIEIEGYVYALDFESAANSIKASQALLGFSYETSKTQLVKGEIDGVPAAIVTSLGYFTGASVLYKLSASYADTSLAASKDIKEETIVDLEKMLAEIKDFVGNEIKALRDEFKPSEPAAEPVVEPVTEPVAPVVEAAPVVEPEVKVDEPVAVITPNQEVTPAETAPVEPVVETPAEPVVETVAAPAAEPVTEDATLNASSLEAEIASLKAELKSLKDEASLQASARKSVAYPTSAIAKFGVEESDDKATIMASIESRKDLTVAQRLEMKLEAMSKAEKQN